MMVDVCLVVISFFRRKGCHAFRLCDRSVNGRRRKPPQGLRVARSRLREGRGFFEYRGQREWLAFLSFPMK